MKNCSCNSIFASHLENCSITRRCQVPHYRIHAIATTTRIMHLWIVICVKWYSKFETVASSLLTNSNTNNGFAQVLPHFKEYN